jgi:hypothetical protein
MGQDFKIDGFQYNMSAPRGGVRIAPFVQSHPYHTGGGRCPWPRWVPAFAGMVIRIIQNLRIGAR